MTFTNKMGFPKCGPGLSKDWNIRSIYFLGLMSLGYMIGEIAHFLIITTSRPVARDIQYGDKGCYDNNAFSMEQKNESIKCEVFQDASSCMAVSLLMVISTLVGTTHIWHKNKFHITINTSHVLDQQSM